MVIVQQLVLKRNRELVAGNRSRTLHQRLHLFLRQGDQQDAVLARVGVEDVREGRGNDAAKTVVRKRPGSMLTRRSTAEILARHQDSSIPVIGMVQNEDRMGRARIRSLLNAPPVIEEKVFITGAFDPLEELLGNDLIGVDVLALKVRDDGGVLAKWLHRTDSTSWDGIGWNCHLRTSVKWPETAAAAAIIGLTRWVRPPRPWRPSKLRLLVEAQRSPGARMSGFIPRHMEQPDSLHSNPESRKIVCNPSCSAACFTACDPGTTIARTLGATRRPLTAGAAARRSSRREFVQEPIKTRSTEMSSMRVPGSSPMYSSIRSTAGRSAFTSLTSGMRPSTGAIIPGFVPQVTNGASCAASTSRVASYRAPGSEASVRQRMTASSQFFGAKP